MLFGLVITFFLMKPIKMTGTLLKVLGEALSKVKNIELINITIGQ